MRCFRGTRRTAGANIASNGVNTGESVALKVQKLHGASRLGYVRQQNVRASATSPPSEHNQQR